MGTALDARRPLRLTTREPRTVVLGDSWIRGLGPERRQAFGKRLAAAAGASAVLDLAAVSRTAVDVVDDHLDAITAFAPDLAVVGVGGADSLIFPAAWIQRAIDRHAPPAWHGVEGLMVPAYRPRDRRRRWMQRAETVAKLGVKQVLVTVFGGHRRVGVAEFETAMRTLLDHLSTLQCAAIVVGFPPVDPVYSPRTNASVRRTNAVLARLCADRDDLVYVESGGFLRRWEDYLSDHVHLSASGHQRVAEGVLGRVSWDLPEAGIAVSGAAHSAEETA